MTRHFSGIFPTENLRQQRSTRAIFLVAGLGVSAWAPLIPLVKRGLQLDDGELGLLLFCVAAGSMLAMPFSGRLIHRVGYRALILCCALLLCVCLSLLLSVTSPAAMGGVLLLFGAANGLLDVSMNSQAVVVEREAGQARMAGFHSFFSLGCIAGAGSISLLLWANMPPRYASVLVALAMAVIVLAASGHLLAKRPQHSGAAGAGTSGYAAYRYRVLFYLYDRRRNARLVCGFSPQRAAGGNAAGGVWFHTLFHRHCAGEAVRRSPD